MFRRDGHAEVADQETTPLLTQHDLDEHTLPPTTVYAALFAYPRAVAWSVFFSIGVVMAVRNLAAAI